MNIQERVGTLHSRLEVKNSSFNTKQEFYKMID